MKKIFLTGASSGIGRAIAQRLCAAGHEVWGTSRDPARIPSLGHLHPVRLDLAELAGIGAVFETAWREAGHFDVVINNAGGGHFDAAEILGPEKIEELFRTLVFAHIELCRLAFVAMNARQSGLIINVTSLASRLPVPFMSAYNAAKAAMASYTFSLQLELSDRQVRIVDLQPADICTSFNDSISPQPSDDARVSKTWEVVQRNMQNAPPPDLVARRVLRLIESANPPPRVTVGDVFQSRIAPLIFRFLPQRVRVWGLKKYYGI
jgi:NAD(P)-dependent dehydrogenase (short-subunit alcohol dehydrogenase family)